MYTYNKLNIFKRNSFNTLQVVAYRNDITIY